MKRFDVERALNEALTPISIFVEAYNKTLPLGFPRASEKTLREFQVAYPPLFKNGDGWAIHKHRKRFMDWHMTHHVGAEEKRER